MTFPTEVCAGSQGINSHDIDQVIMEYTILAAE